MFTYQIEDDTNTLSNTVTVTMDVILTNSAPVANTGSLTVNEDTQLLGVVTGTDPEMSTLTYILDAPTTQGTLSLSATG